MDGVPLPRLHFTPRAGEAGEIIGVVRSGGRYQLFYETPDGWGQATSDDLVLWWEQPVADPLPEQFRTGTPGEVPIGDAPSVLTPREGARGPQLFPLDGVWVLLADASYAVGDYDGRTFTPQTRGVFGRGRLGRVVTFADAAGRRCALAQLPGPAGAFSLPWVLSVRARTLLATPHPHLDPYLTSGATGLTATGGEVRDNGELILRMPAGGETLVVTDADIVEVTVEGVSGVGAARRSIAGFSGVRVARFA
ncbi:hypothetical protein AB0F72_26450 [Actinoplanes sp. NPDC023936]|uniref:hypothetical protein n=1 Tax=Actinoplanes sp. NPDC023936 TaxID=3154910 RepID=UPI0033C10A31